MDKRLHPAVITAARDAGHPIRMIRGAEITWAGSAPDAEAQDAILSAATMGDRKDAVRAECRRRIYAVASAETQSNMAMAQGQIAARSEAERSAGDRDILSGIAAALAWVQEMRAAYAALSADPEADYRADGVWPECPPEVQDVVGRF
ncbi:hypothetical protein [Palleronia caenipelagi]|uniref:Uncharacterized protein n=1 Tax=Palleronia caenipelagi TaxID=2489174 RepID=A0A547PSA2_9RHOB|nr:hypothetical protein [Palleronia caenipelagi]TRD16971.1 hypothetical protein FEV53_13625 [Palleronia caenipelagi]